MNKLTKKKKGFTLIELIIVIAILGILALIAIPKFGSAQKDAKIKADIATGKTIADTTATLIAKGEDITAFRKSDLVKKPVKLSGKILDALGSGEPKAQQQKLKNQEFYILINENDDVEVYVGADTKNQVYPKHTGEYENH